ncbi:hypothetical protein GCM10029964_051650 [Kibdelosporangium lantanae]
MIARAQERGEIDGSDVDRVHMAVLVVVQGLATMAVSGMAGDRSPEVLVTGTVRTLVDGLRPRP